MYNTEKHIAEILEKIKNNQKHHRYFLYKANLKYV